MEYSIPEPEPERRPVGLSYALGSLYDRFQGLSDPRKAKGKRYSLLTLLIERLFAPQQPIPGFGRIATREAFNRPKPPTAARRTHRPTSGQSDNPADGWCGVAGSKSARSRRVKCSMTISIGRAWAKSIGSNASLAGYARARSTKPAVKSNGALPAYAAGSPRRSGFWRFDGTIG